MKNTTPMLVESLEARRHFAAQAYDWNSVTMKGTGFIDGIVYSPTQQNLVYMHTDMGGAYRWDQPLGRWTPLNDWTTNSDSQAKYLGVETLAVDPTDATRVYMAAGTYLDSSGTAILRSTDQGRTWSRTNVGGIQSNGNGNGRNAGERMMVDPNSPNILFYGTRNDGMWKSTNYGQTWAPITFPTVGDSAGTTRDVGITFVLFDKSSALSAGTASQTIYAGVATTAANKVFRSLDGGSTWAALPGQPTASNHFPLRGAIAPGAANADPDTLYITYSQDDVGPNGSTGGTVQKIVDPDAVAPAWTNVTPGAGQGGWSGIAIDPNNPSNVYATTLDRWWPADQVYRSTNAGSSWTALNPNDNRDDTSAPHASTGNMHWLGDIQVDPFNSGAAMITTGYGIYRTTNLAAAAPKWTFFNEGFEQAAVRELASPSSGSLHLLSAIGDRDGFRHDNLAVSPQRFSPRWGTNTDIDVAENAPSKVVRIGGGYSKTDPDANNNVTYTFNGAYSGNGGTSWTTFSGATLTQPAATAAPSSGGNIAISADGTRIVWAVPGLGWVKYSTDNGQTWNAISGSAVPTSSKIVSDRAAPQTFYAYSGSNFYRSTDGGASWTTMTTTAPSNNTWIRPVFGQPGHILMSRGSNGLGRSINGGATWTQLPIGTVDEVGVGKSATAGGYPAIYVGGTIGGVTGFFRSDDQGASWTTISDLSHQYGAVTVIQGDPQVYGRLYVGANGRGILYGDIHALPAALPAGWSTGDIGSPGSAGAAGQATPGVYELIGGGAGVGGTADSFRFAYKTLSGDGVITARVLDLSSSSPANNNAKAGVMIRSTLASNSANAFVAVTPGSVNGVAFQARASAGGSTSTIANATTNVWPPYWVRLVRVGNSFTAYRSADGNTWTQVGTTQSIAMGTDVFVGLAVTSSDNNNLNISRIESVSIAGPPTATIAPVAPDPQATGVPAFTITFSQPVTGFDLNDLTLTRDGGSVSLAGANLSSADGGKTWTLSATSAMTDRVGSYALALASSGTGIALAAGGVPIAGGASEAWVMNVLRGRAAVADAINLVRNGSVVEYRIGGALQYTFNTAPLPELIVDGLEPADDLVLSGNVAARLTGTPRLHGLSLGGGAKLEVGSAALAVIAGDAGAWSAGAYSGLTGSVAQGRNGGAWNGDAGITSAAAAAGDNRRAIGVARAGDVLGIGPAQTATWNGQIVTGDTVLLRYTFAGDSDLNGRLDGDDYFAIDSHVAPPGAYWGWYNGDFNFNGKIDGDDYFVLDSNIGRQGVLL
ncbi:MAG TPA: Ig-like domain-containing protein [Tepidisphaeraceae bacterium]|nr:Ig-like domain-containing protein [Tepidisphaeraceae bacterium]